METIKMMVSIGLAWSVLPHSMLDDSVLRLPISDASLSRDLGYIVHTERTLSNAARAFMAMLNVTDPPQYLTGTTPAALDSGQRG